MEDSVCGGVQSDCKCGLCKVRKQGRITQYCGECRKYGKALRKDAETHDWLSDFETMTEHADTFSAMMQ